MIPYRLVVVAALAVALGGYAWYLRSALETKTLALASAQLQITLLTEERQAALDRLEVAKTEVEAVKKAADEKREVIKRVVVPSRCEDAVEWLRQEVTR